jgi:hypothetical protein
MPTLVVWLQGVMIQRRKATMNEAQWLPGTSPVGMLQSLRGKISDRKLRLFACACCRRVWDLLPDDANRNLVVAAENYPEAPSWPKSYDGLQEWARKYPELDDAMRASSAGEREWGAWDGNGSYWAVKYLGRGFYKLSPLESANTVSLKIALEVRPRPSLQSREIANAGLKRSVDSPCLPWLELHCDPSMDRIPKSGQVYRSATIAEGQACPPR